MGKNKILLINPEIDPKTQTKLITNIIRASFPFSLGHLASYILNNSLYTVQIADDQIEPITETVLQELVGGMDHPKIVGLTTLTATCSRVYELADEIKKINPNVVIILGGVHASVVPEECLSRNSVDAVVRGEGEITFLEVVDNILNERDYRYVKGISYRQKGKIKHNESRTLLKDLDLLPPFPYHIFEKNKNKYSGFFSVHTSRGCPYGCTFCSQRSISGRTYRYVSTQRAISEVETLINNYEPTVIRIIDDNIGANKKRLVDFLNTIIKKGINKRVSFEAPMRGDNLDMEILLKLKEANFSLLTFGLETANESLMKKINKGETVADVVRAIKMTAEKGIETGTTLIFGLPTETNRDRWDAIKLVSSLPLDSVRFNILTPYPGTPIFNDLRKEGKIVIKNNWHNFSVQYMWIGDDLPYVPEGTNKYELMFFTMLANLIFYVRPSGLLKLLTKSNAGGNVIALKKKWYFSLQFFKILTVGLYLIKRFLEVTIKMIINKKSY